jgi:integrase/recombinase XerD
MMLEELQRRNYSEITTRKYLQYVTAFARHFGKSPDQLGPNELRSYQAYLLQERKVTPGTAVNCVAALRFFFIKTLKRHQFREFLPYPKDRRRLPTVLSREEVSRLINAAGTLFRRTLLMTLYGTGMRRSELAHLKVGDIDSQRMIIRVVAGKGGKDRDLPLSPTLLETLREYWRWRKPKLYLFPTRTRGLPVEEPISDKTVWIACSEAARRAGHQQTRHAAYAAPQLGHPLVGSGHRPADHPSSAWSRRSGDHRSVPASVATAFAGRQQSAGWSDSRWHRERQSSL